MYYEKICVLFSVEISGDSRGKTDKRSLVSGEKDVFAEIDKRQSRYQKMT